MRIVAHAATVIGASFLSAAIGGCDADEAREADLAAAIGGYGADDAREPDFSERLLEIAGEYKEYDLVNGTLNWAPTRCIAPYHLPHLSASDDEQTHGRKLYFLFAAELTPYLDAPQKKNPKGQVLVKESWTAEEVTVDKPVGPADKISSVRLSLHAEHDGKKYQAGQQRELFIMFKSAPDTPGTDNGWVYGTVTADGQKVTSVGRLESCMECHREAGDDRLFGPK